jgi:hypothetical protein
MFTLTEIVDSKNRTIRITANTGLESELREGSFSNLIVVVLNSKSIGEDDTISEIEDFFQKQLEAFSETTFIGKITEVESVEFYFYINKKGPLPEIESDWNHRVIKIPDPELFFYKELLNNNVLNVDNFQTIAGIPELLNSWKKIGVDIQNEFPVMFSFYSAFKNESAEFEKELQKHGYDVTRKTKRTLIIFKGYLTYAEKIQNWTLENLTSEYSKLVLLSKNYKCIHEGIFSRK